MKTKLMRGGIIAALTAVLAVTAVLIASCPQPVNMDGMDNYNKPPAGYGYVTLKIDYANRSIVPDADQVKFYTVTFTDVTVDSSDNDISDSANDVEETVAAANINTEKFNLKIGKSYSVVVAAFTGGNLASPTQKAAEGSPTANGGKVDVVNAAGATVTVDLAPAMSGSGYLYYNYDLTGVDTLSEATIKATPIPTGTATTIDISSTSEGTQTLTAGFYLVDVTITGALGSYKQRQVLHIYGEMQSSLGADGAPIVIADTNLGKTAWTITFVYDMGTEVTGQTPVVKHVVSTGTATVSAPTPPSVTGFTLEGWYANITLTGAKVTFPHTVAANGTSLYAKWEEQGAEYDFTVTFSEPTDPGDALSITGGATTINLAYGGSVTVTATATGTAPDKYSWVYDDTEIANTASFTLNASDFGTNAYGPYELTLYAEWGTPTPSNYGSAVFTVIIAEPTDP
jgi:hypothetical protein